jgi:hypothetical protein
VPSLLGRIGGVCLVDTTGRDLVDELAFSEGNGEVMTGRAGSRDGLEGDSSSSRGFLNFWEDFRGGGLGGSGESLFCFFFFFSFLSPSRTVELEDDEVRDSLTAASP